MASITIIQTLFIVRALILKLKLYAPQRYLAEINQPRTTTTADGR